MKFVHLLTLAAVAQANAKYTISRTLFAADARGPAVAVQTLSNGATGERVEVLESWGGKLERVSLRHAAPLGRGGSSKPPRDIIASRCASFKTCNASALRSQGAPGALLIPFANRVAYGAYSFGGKRHFLSADNSTVSHGFLIQGRPMQLMAKSVAASSATLVLGARFNGSDMGYPFVVSVNVSYSLSAAGLSVTVRARNDNADGSAAPFMAGCHPYFKLLHGGFEKARLELDRCSQWNRQAQLPIQVRIIRMRWCYRCCWCCRWRCSSCRCSC